MWVSGNLFHIAWNGNYELWKQNPIKTIPIAHSICDPHFGSSDVTNEIAYSGIYNWLYALGFDSVSKHLYNFVIATELLAVTSILLALVHLIYLDSKMAATKFEAYKYCTSSIAPFGSGTTALPGEISFNMLVATLLIALGAQKGTAHCARARASGNQAGLSQRPY
jgi:hypothetical protein